MPDTAVPSPWRNRAIAIGVLLAIIVLVLFLLRNCHSTPLPPAAAVPPPPADFDYFKAKAAELQNDPAKILAFVRDTTPTLDYRGNVKGPLGALWNSAASPDEKKPLAEALLAAAGTPRTLTLDDVAPTRDPKQDALAPATLTILHRILTATTPQDTPLYDGPPGPLVGDVHSLELPSPNLRRITLRTIPPITKEITLPDDALGEDLLFTWNDPRLPAKSPIYSSTRELWHRDNLLGPASPATTDRHDFVVLPCRISPYVREKEQLLLAQRKRAQSPEAPAYLTLLDYALRSDAQLPPLEKQLNVTARFAQPRILLLSQSASPDLPNNLARSLDLRLNSADFSGDRPSAYRATQIRSLLESALAQQFLQQATHLPARSAFSIFSLLKDDTASTLARRIAHIQFALQSLQLERSESNSITFSAPTSSPERPASVSARWSPLGIELRTGPLSQTLLKNLPPNPASTPLASSATLLFKDPDEAAAAIETALLAADVSPPTPFDYALSVTCDRKSFSLAQNQARFSLKWKEGKTETEQTNRILSTTDGLSYQWRIQSGVLPVAGIRHLTPTALADSLTHNPWYRAGSSQQSDATSFVFSRKVHQSIHSGKPIDLTMQGPLGPKGDPASPRPVDFTAPLSPIGPSTITVTVNGFPETRPILQATLQNRPISILDDPAFPLGLANQLQSVVTSVRCRLLDSRNSPVVGATVRILDRLPTGIPLAQSEAPSAPDGLFQFPAPLESDSYGKVSLQITFANKATQILSADLTNPGTSIITLQLARPPTPLLYLAYADRRLLETLPFSESLKRHARRDLAAGLTLIIPATPVNDGLRDFIAYYACNLATGEFTPILEEGLAGATNSFTPNPPAPPPAETQPDIQSVATTQTTQPSAEPPTPTAAPTPPESFPAYNRALLAWHSLARPLPPDSPSNPTYLALKSWADATDIAGPFAPLTDAQLPAKTAELLKAGRINAGGNYAKPILQLGYISTLRYLSPTSEVPDAK